MFASATTTAIFPALSEICVLITHFHARFHLPTKQRKHRLASTLPLPQEKVLMPVKTQVRLTDENIINAVEPTLPPSVVVS